MPRITLIFAILLILLGVVGYTGDAASSPATDTEAVQDTQPTNGETVIAKPKRSVTALIPAFTGGLLLIFGVVALNEKWRMHGMHGAVLIGLLGFLAAGGRAATGLGKLMSADASVNTRSLFFVCMMALLCGVYVVLCVNSFIQARKRRRAAAAEDA